MQKNKSRFGEITSFFFEKSVEKKTGNETMPKKHSAWIEKHLEGLVMTGATLGLVGLLFGMSKGTDWMNAHPEKFDIKGFVENLSPATKDKITNVFYAMVMSGVGFELLRSLGKLGKTLRLLFQTDETKKTN